jgi:pyruvate dehydrogenase E1 component
MFVVNCNLQRLDGPVRGNGKIIQELESELPRRRLERHQGHLGRRTGIRCFARDKEGILRKRMMEAVDGEYQTFKSKDGAYVREHFFGNTPELPEMVAD